MSVLQELENRLVDTEERITALIENLEDHAELEESLRTAGSGLHKASAEVSRLVESAQAANESLSAVLASFRDAVEILRKSDPARATEAVARIEEKLKTADLEIRETIDGATTAISGGQQKLELLLTTESQKIRDSIPKKVAYTTLAFVVLLVIVEVVRFFPGLLSQ